MTDKTDVDYLLEEAKELSRLRDNNKSMIKDHRKRWLNLIQSPETTREQKRSIIKIIGITTTEDSHGLAKR